MSPSLSLPKLPAVPGIPGMAHAGAAGAGGAAGATASAQAAAASATAVVGDTVGQVRLRYETYRLWCTQFKSRAWRFAKQIKSNVREQVVRDLLLLSSKVLSSRVIRLIFKSE